MKIQAVTLRSRPVRLLSAAVGVHTTLNFNKLENSSVGIGVYPWFQLPELGSCTYTCTPCPIYGFAHSQEAAVPMN